MSMQNGKPFVHCSIFMGLGLKSDGHGNGGTLINGNGGTHYDLSKFRQPSYIINRLFASIIYLNIFWKQWNTFSLVSRVLFEV